MYIHTLTIKLATHHPVAPENFGNQVKKMLGPWCDEVGLVKINDVEVLTDSTIPVNLEE